MTRDGGRCRRGRPARRGGPVHRGRRTAVADRLRDRAAHATGAASEVLAATATLAQDRAWLGAAEKRIKDGTPPCAAVAAAVDQFVDMFTQLGGLMAERVTDLRDIRDRVIAELSGLPEPGVPLPDVPSILCAEDLAPADTAGLDPTLVVALATTLGGPTSHTAIIARQLGIPCVVAVDGLDAVARRTRWCSSTARWAPSPCHPTTAAAGEAVAAAQREAELRSALDGSRRHRRRARGVDPRQRPGRRRGPRRPRDPGRGRRPVPHRAVLPQPRHRAERRRSRPTSTARCSRRSPGRKVVIRTLDAGSGQAAEVRRASRGGQPGARRAGHPHRRGQPGAAGPPARGHRRRGASAPATRHG